jgi:hypothetical protein
MISARSLLWRFHKYNIVFTLKLESKKCIKRILLAGCDLAEFFAVDCTTMFMQVCSVKYINLHELVPCKRCKTVHFVEVTIYSFNVLFYSFFNGACV